MSDISGSIKHQSITNSFVESRASEMGKYLCIFVLHLQLQQGWKIFHSLLSISAVVIWNRNVKSYTANLVLLLFIAMTSQEVNTIHNTQFTRIERKQKQPKNKKNRRTSAFKSYNRTRKRYFSIPSFIESEYNMQRTKMLNRRSP